MIRSSACQRQADPFPALSGRHGDCRSYTTQWDTIAISVTVNAIIALMAGSIALFLAGRPFWMVVQRWLMGTVLAGLAVRMATEAQR